MMYSLRSILTSPAMSLVGLFGRPVKVASLTGRILDHVMGPHGILSTKARILVTNSVHYASEFDHIIYLRRGIVLESGPYAKLMADQDSELSKVMYVESFCTRHTS